MAANQYLFRLIHPPISDNPRPWSEFVQFFYLQNVSRAEPSHTDILVSLPETTSDLSHFANKFVQAVCSLQIWSGVLCVVAWQLSDERDADHETPVLILHPWMMPKLAPRHFHSPGSTYQPDLHTTIFEGNTNWFVNESNHAFQGGSYYGSYDLCEPVPAGYAPDPFYACVESREKTTGRYTNYVHMRSVSAEDWYVNHKRNLVMSTRGTLALTRFPLYNEAMESLPYQHTGWTLSDGKRLLPRQITYGDRVLNLVSDRRNQRRLWERRSKAANVVTIEWYRTLQRLMRYLWANEVAGQTYCQKGQLYFNNEEEPVEWSMPYVPWVAMWENLEDICLFINLVGVATGNHELLIAHPAWDEYRQEQVFRDAQNRLRDEAGTVSQYAVKGKTKQLRVLQAIVDNLNVVFHTLLNFKYEIDYLALNDFPPTRLAALGHANRIREQWQDLSNNWAMLQSDVLGVLGLFMTWELLWDVAERGEVAERAPRYEPYNKWNIRAGEHPADYPRPPVVTNPPSIFNRFSTARPHFAPFRMWEGIECADTLSQAEQDEYRERQWEAWDAYYTRLKDAEAAREHQRLEEAQERFEVLKEMYRLAGEPNPNDPWDYRNYQNLEWWKNVVQNGINDEMFYRALDLPDELDGFNMTRAFVRKVGQKAGKTALALRRDIEFYDARPRFHAGPQWRPIFKWVFNQALDIAIDIAWSELGDQLTELAVQMSDNDEMYSARQFWPSSPYGVF